MEKKVVKWMNCSRVNLFNRKYYNEGCIIIDEERDYWLYDYFKRYMTLATTREVSDQELARLEHVYHKESGKND